MSSSSKRYSQAFVAFVSLACASAAAQTAPVDAPATPVVAPEAAPDSADAAAARGAVARARELFRVGDFSAALTEFLRAHELLHDDLRQADVLNNIAVCYERMFRYDLALQYYERYLSESTTANTDDRAEVEGVMTSLRDLLGTVRITGHAGAEVWIDDRMFGQVPLDVLVPAGLHVIEIRASNYQAQRRELRVSAHAVQDIDAQLELIDAYRGLPSTYFWVGTGLTAAAAITGTAFGIAALSEDAAGDRDADRMLHVDSQATKDLATQADIAFGVALAFAAGTTVLYFLTDWGSTTEQQRSGTGTAKLSFGVTTDAVGLSLIGSIR